MYQLNESPDDLPVGQRIEPVITVTDAECAKLLAYLSTPEGKNVLLAVIQENARAVRTALGLS